MNFIAGYVHRQGLRGRLLIKRIHDMKTFLCRAAQSRVTFSTGARHTTKQAVNLSENEVFSRSNTSVLGLGVPNRKAGSTTCFVCLNPVPPYALDRQTVVSSVQQGTRTMTNVTPTPTAATPGTAPNPHHVVARQAAIENALSMALHHIRADGPKGLYAATGKAIRAVSLLKQACADFTTITAQAKRIQALQCQVDALAATVKTLESEGETDYLDAGKTMFDAMGWAYPQALNEAVGRAEGAAS